MNGHVTYERASELLTYDPESGELRWKLKRGHVAAGSIAGSIRPNFNTFYSHIQIDRRMYKTHRIIWLLHFKTLPDFKIDHIDRNGVNNRISNLRLATNSQSSINRTFKQRAVPRA